MSPDPEFRAAVVAEIEHAWGGYVEHAWGFDELRPLTRDGANWHGEVSLGLTIVDSLDTLHLAGMDAERDRAIAYIRDELRFDVDATVSVFETNIRQLGGLLSAYELVHEPVLLERARDLGDRLLLAFDSPTGIPYGRIHLGTGEPSSPEVDVAEAGTYLVEFMALSRATGDPRFEDAARRAYVALDATRDPMTGLTPSGVNVETGRDTIPVAQIGGGADSYFEYLCKAAILGRDAVLADAYRATVDPLHQYLPETDAAGRIFYGWVRVQDGRRVASLSGALDCFFPGLLALEGDLERARGTLEGCWHAYETFGHLPDSYNYQEMTILAANHELRPELAESLFLLFRATGEPLYRERGRQLLARLIQDTRVDSGGYTVISDVRTSELGNGMPRFFLAETLKYLLLLAEGGDVIPLDEWVFNTEAHPIPR